MPPPFASHSVWTRTYEPTFKHVSVPGTYQKPAPYRLQTFTYSTGLAFTARSAARAPAPAPRPPPQPRPRLFLLRIPNPPVWISGGAFDLRSPSPPRHHLPIKRAWP